MVTHTALWQAINAYELDDADAALPFSRRLARDNGWSHGFALSAIAEYKRFIYLICTSGTVLTPSEEIDAVWHLHLLYTRDYWNRFCGETLGREIHHGPTRGGEAEAGKYLGCYRDTLALYDQVFGTPPPDLWPDEAKRFTPVRTVTLNADDHIILPKRQVFLCLSLAMPIALAGCEMAFPMAPVYSAAVWAGFGLVGLFFLTVNLAKIVKCGLIGFIFIALFFITVGELWLGTKIGGLMGKLAGEPLDPAYGYGLVGLLALLLAINAHTKARGQGNSGSGCGSGCSSSDSGCGSSCGGGCGGD